MAAKSPARGHSRAKSSSPKQKRAPAQGRRSRSLAKDKEEQPEQEERDESDEQEEDAAAAAADEEEQDGEEAKVEHENDKVMHVDDEAKVENESDKVTPVDEMAADKPDTAPPGDSQTQPSAASPVQDLDSVGPVEDLPHVDRKRKFDEIEDKSDEDEEEAGVVSPAKVLKVCEESDVKRASVEAPVDGEMASTAEAAAESDMMAASKLSLPISSETNIEDDYVVITPDDVPPVDSDEMLNTVAKMLQPDLSSAVSGSCSNATLDTAAIQNPLLQREYVANPAVFEETVDILRRFTLGSYNILADFHAQRDYGTVSWLTPEQLSQSSRHERLMEELSYLDEDIICLQEVGGDYMHDVLQPTLER